MDYKKEIGNIEAICPYCNKELEKKPGRKKKCPFCGNFIYVRTRPYDSEKVLVTETQIKELEKQWEDRREKFTYRPKGNDAEWGELNRKIQELIEAGDLHSLIQKEVLPLCGRDTDRGLPPHL